MRWRTATALLAIAGALTGCVTNGGDLMADARAAASRPVARIDAGAMPATAGPVSAQATPRADALDRPAPDTMRWLYGSGEAAAASIQAYRMLADYAVAKARQRSIPQSVAMGLPDAMGGVGTPNCMADDGSIKPRAVVFDVDETVILNRGFEYWTALGHAYNSDAWRAWADNGAPFVAPVPGAVDGLKRIRDAGLTVIFNTNRKAESAAGTAAAIEAAGLGPAVHGETLFLAGDDALGSDKDGRRATIAKKWCVIALAGDNLGDFANVFNDGTRGVQARRDLAARGTLAQLWGNGWFVLPNPVYGDAIKGSVGEVFPPDARWTPGQ